MNTSITSASLRRAADIKDHIDRLNRELFAILGNGEPEIKPKRRMSLHARRLIAAAQKARWAKLKVK